MSELALRYRRKTSRHEVELAAAADFDLGRLHVQPSTLQLVSDGNSSTLEPRVMQALIVLAQHREQVVSRDQLVTQCCMPL